MFLINGIERDTLAASDRAIQFGDGGKHGYCRVRGRFPGRSRGVPIPHEYTVFDR